MGQSTYLSDEYLDQIFRGTTYTSPTVLGVALCTSAPTDSETGSTIMEVANANGYARVTCNPSTSDWTAASAGSLSNAVTITFPAATGSWGTATHFAILDSTTWGSGNLLFWGALGSSSSISSGQTASFSAGSLTVSIA